MVDCGGNVPLRGGIICIENEGEKLCQATIQSAQRNLENKYRIQKNCYSIGVTVFLLERVMGIEPTYLAWKASVLPLNYTRICPEPESNQRHKDFQSFALPTELSGQADYSTSTILHY